MSSRKTKYPVMKPTENERHVINYQEKHKKHNLCGESVVEDVFANL